MLLIASLTGSSGGITVENYTSIITNAYYRRAMWNSIWLSLIVTVVTLVIAGVIAFFLARTEFKGKKLIHDIDNISNFPSGGCCWLYDYYFVWLYGCGSNGDQVNSGKSQRKKIAYTILGIFFCLSLF